eukprot:Nitzschia sp. Nitz4//scaffold35_size145790//91671//93755//NITZ4_003037-RA/size145790-processed-gene-0.95-mRNA-1//-1//CDS//3329549145//1179//frame0
MAGSRKPRRRHITPPPITGGQQINGSNGHTQNGQIYIPHYQPLTFMRALKYIVFAFVVFVGQIAISVTLKRYGYIEKDFNELVAERVLHVQYRIENTTGAFLTNMNQFNTSLYWFRSLNESLPSMPSRTQPLTRPGFRLAQEGAKAKYPIVMIPGFVTSGLEVWQGKECAKQLFRQRVWGGVGMVQHWLMERHCVMEHMALDPITGMDPEGIRVRAAQGFESADYFAGNYWVWSKLLENLADIGYDGSLMTMEPYDWRLAFPKLEERDGYLTKLKYKIEAFHKTTGRKVVLTSHSLGGILVHYFFAWVVTSEWNGGGGGGRDWVDKHIHAYINIAGAQLGVPKAISAILSGEMSDTVFLGAVGSLLEQFIGRRVRRDLWATWGGLWSMIPKGGDALWGVGADTNDGTEVEVPGSNAFDEFMFLMSPDLAAEEKVCKVDEVAVDVEAYTSASAKALREFSNRTQHNVSSLTSFLTSWGGGIGPSAAAVKTTSFDPKAKPSPATWHDISRTPLPKAPNLKIYCLYGVGLDTERGYYYKKNKGESTADPKSAIQPNKTCPVVDPPFVLDMSVEDPANNVVHGIKYTDGDGSVPLLSLGYMCADGWRRREYGLNPGNTKVVSREYTHKQETLLDDPMRGGPYSADHVDVMGNLYMMEDFLKIVSDHDVLEDQIVSDIHGIAERLRQDPRGGLKKKRFY